MKKTGIILLILFVAPSLLFAGGGFYFGHQMEEFAFIPEWELPSHISNYGTVGGFAYGVDNKGFISGGFGEGITESSGAYNIYGGLGGIIKGYQLIHRPIHLGIMAYGGLGGVSVSGPGVNDAFFIGSFEADAELGLPITDWFMPVVYAGYRWMGNFAPGEILETFVSYGPVAGIRFSFGNG